MGELSSALLDAPHALAPFLSEITGGSSASLVSSGAISHVVNMSKVENLTTVPKTENSGESSFSETSIEPDEHSFMQENAQVQKRKGGRKPVRGPRRRVSRES